MKGLHVMLAVVAMLTGQTLAFADDGAGNGGTEGTAPEAETAITEPESAQEASAATGAALDTLDDENASEGESGPADGDGD